MRLAAAVLAVAVLAVTGCGGAADRSAKIAAEIGGACAATDYQIIQKLTNSKSRIYDCTKGAKRMCVTEEGGIAHDSTVTVRFLFQGTLSGGKPGCLSG